MAPHVREGKKVRAILMSVAVPRQAAAVTTHCNQVTNSGASVLPPTEPPPSSVLFTNTMEIDTTLPRKEREWVRESKFSSFSLFLPPSLLWQMISFLQSHTQGQRQRQRQRERKREILIFLLLPNLRVRGRNETDERTDTQGRSERVGV